MIKILKPDFKLANEKGTFIQLVHEGWKQINVLESPKGSVRGGHYHKKNQEAFFVIKGNVKLKVFKPGTEEQQEFSEGDFFLIEKMVRHDFEFIEDTIMVSMYDQGVEHEDGSKDIYDNRQVRE